MTKHIKLFNAVDTLPNTKSTFAACVLIIECEKTNITKVELDNHMTCHTREKPAVNNVERHLYRNLFFSSIQGLNLGISQIALNLMTNQSQ